MRVLFTAGPGTGHFHPLVPVAKALQQAGHTVAFATADSSREMVERSGFGFFSTGAEWMAMVAQGGMGGMKSFEDFQRIQREMMKTDLPAFLKMMLQMFVGRFGNATLPQVIAAASTFRPDLIVRNSMEYAGCVAAEHLGLPHASIQVGGVRPGDYPPEALVEQLDALRAKAQLPPDPALQMLYRYLHLSLMPASYFQGGMPATTHYLSPRTFDQSGSEGLPAWVEKREGRPILYITLGTVANRLLHLLNPLIAGVRDEPLEIIVTVGRDQDPAQLGPQPPNVHVERYIPQSLLLPKCELAIMHGGYSSISSGLIHGLPLVIVPVAADQPMNARLSQAFGAAEVLDTEALTPEVVRSAVRKVRSTPSYRQAAQRFQADAATLPPVEHAVALLERLVKEKAPLPGA